MRNDHLVFDATALDVALARTGLRTLTALADRVGISRARLYTIRAGYVPRELVRRRIAAALGVAVETLWHTTEYAGNATRVAHTP